MNSILRLALPVPLHSLFDYRLDHDVDGAVAPVVEAGCRVLVSFGPREMVGVVVEQVSATGIDPAKLKSVLRILDEKPLLTPELTATLRWASRYYHHPLGEVLQAALPVTLRSAHALPEPGVAALQLTCVGRDSLASGSGRKSGRKQRLLQALAEGARSVGQLGLFIKDLTATTRTALAQGLIERVRVDRDPPAVGAIAGPTLNDEQRVAADAVIAASGGFAAFVLDGVTGSGKTEVYLDIIRACLAEGRQALVLVPEIALTPQALRRFRERLGIDIAALHSGLGEGERARAWLAAARGEASIILGTRSSIFVPLAHPGVIIVDEEHDASYKQQDGFRYHARDLAVMRAKALDIAVVLGSATPSLESLANVAAGRYASLRLNRRAGFAQPPALHVVDLRRQSLQHGLAASTLEAIGTCIARGEQALIFKNRRGYAPVLMCHDCAWSAQCPDCDRAMTLHRAAGRLRCHHCGFEQRAPQSCPSCGGATLRPIGEGTERLEEVLGERFPDVPIVRVDRDTTRGRRMRDALMDSLPGSGARILVGTQMLAKGHDLPHLTLVVVVGVDEGLHSVDFRASERLGQLVVQVAGRAGRAERAGSVILQTHDPAHPLLATLLNGGYRALSAQLLTEREAAALPPFAPMALLRAECRDKAVMDGFLLAATRAAADPRIVLHGPLAAPMPRRAGAYRGQILIEAQERSVLQAFLSIWLDAVRALPGDRAVRWSIDVDPVDLY